MAKTRLSLNAIKIPDLRHLSAVEPIDKNKEDTVLVWYDPKSDSRYDIQHAKKRLNQVIRNINFYTESQPCISFIQSINDKKIFIVTSGLHASDVLPPAGNLPQIDCIFIFCMRKDRYEYLYDEYPKIVDIFVTLDSLCTSIKQQIDHAENNLQSFSFFDPDKQMTQYLSKQLSEFLCLQLFKHVILQQPRSARTKKQMIDVCRQFYEDDLPEQKLIDQFEHNYQPEEAIRWYSKQSFLYKMINNALRKRDINQLYPFRFFIADLSRSIAQEHEKTHFNEKILVFYRGIKLASSELEKFKNHQGKLVSTNGFFSTSRNRSQALSFAKKSTKRTDINTTLIEIRCNVKQLGGSVIFADITPFSEFPEENEVLFDLGSVFRIENVGHDEDIWVIRMNATSDGQTITENYIREMRLDTEELSVPIMLGIVMYGMGQYKKSHEYFERMLAEPNGEDLASIEYHIGKALDLKGDLLTARRHYDQAYELMMKAKPARIKDSARVLDNIGNILMYQERYDEALDYFRRALTIQEKYHPYRDGSLAITLNKIGNILAHGDKYDEALELHQRALAIQEKFYPFNYANIATTLTNIGDILTYQGKYDNAYEYHERALKIREKCYPSDHIEVANSFGGFGNVLYGQGKYNEALEYHRRALYIQEKHNPSGHIDTAHTLNRMAAILRAQEKNDEAIEHLQRALKIKEECYPFRHRDIASTLNNIGLMYEDKGDYDRSVEYHEKALWMKEGLSQDDASIATSYGNLASVYAKKGRYELALEHKKKFLANRQKELPSDDLYIADCLYNVADAYEQVNDRQMALKNYKQALAIYQKKLPIGHSSREKTERSIQRLSGSNCTIL